MSSVDMKKVYREHYSAKADEPVVVDVPPRPFLMIDGAGDPNTSQEYLCAIQALYPLAYGLRAAVKRATGDAYVVMPLEGLWWAEDMLSFDPADKSNWLWTAMIGGSLDAARAADALQLFWGPSFPIDQTGATDVEISVRLQLGDRRPTDVVFSLQELPVD